MSETWIDKNSGKLYIGRDIAAPFLDYRADDMDGTEPELTPLAPLIDAKELGFATDDFERTRGTDWLRDDFITYGRWVLRLLHTVNPERALRVTHLERVRELGLGPSITFLSEFDDSVTEFKRALGTDMRYSREQYADWSIADFVQHARTVAGRGKRQHKPLASEYEALYELGKGPSRHFIAARVGGIAKLHEYLGYPDILSWGPDEFVAWGVDALRENPQTGISTPVIEELSRRKYGPSLPTIRQRFGDMAVFRARVENELERQDEATAKVRQEKLETYCLRYIDTGLIDPRRIDSDDRLIEVGAQFQLVDHFLPGLPPSIKRELAHRTTKRFMRSLLMANRRAVKAGLSRQTTLLPGMVEAEAARREILDDLWPLKDTAHLQLNLPVGGSGRHIYQFGDYRKKLAAQAGVQ